jgi:asparagine synthase (glutamine-hydrolysing)
MPSGLHALSDVPIAPDRQAMTRFLALLPEYDTSSFFEGIEKVPPGHIMTVSADRVSLRRYWNPAPAPLRYKRRSDYEEAIRESLDVAVEAMLRGAGNKVGSHLSSGLDSSAVTATAARLMGRSRSVVAYTATPREGYGASNLGDSIVDEWGLAAKVAGLYPNIEHVRVQTGPSSPVELLDKYFYLYQRPFLNLCNGVWAHAILADARQRGLQVFLTGRGGNSSFSYDGMVALPAMLRKGQLIRLAHSVALLRKRHIRWGTMTAQCLGPFLPDFAWRAVKRLRGRSHKLTDFTALHSDAASQLMASSKAGGVPLDPASRPTADAGEARRRIREFADSGNYNKAALGGWGIDYRDPASDRRLVELCLSIPAEEFLGPLPRDLARRTFADRLPREIVEERRKGYQAADWHEGFTAALPQIEEELERVFSAGGADDLLDSRKMKQLLASCPSDGWNDFANVQKYRMSLLRGISAGHFLRRAKGSNA